MDFNKAYKIYRYNWKDGFRYYHTIDHLNFMLSHTDNLIFKYFSLFHDIIYNPKFIKEAEKASALFFKKESFNFDDITKLEKELIYKMILETKDHKPSKNELIQEALDLDMLILYQPFEKLLEYEKGIFKEYQFVDLNVYKKNRIEFLEKHKEKGDVKYLIEYIKNKKYNIGIYPGSFNPFHIGHLDILKQAEKIFDKVVILKLQNPDKDVEDFSYEVYLNNEFVTDYSLLLDYVSKFKETPCTIIRGLRNKNDFEEEVVYSQWLRELNPDISVVNILTSNPNLYKISSSNIRMLKSLHYNIDKYLVK